MDNSTVFLSLQFYGTRQITMPESSFRAICTTKTGIFDNILQISSSLLFSSSLLPGNVIYLGADTTGDSAGFLSSSLRVDTKLLISNSVSVISLSPECPFASDRFFFSFSPQVGFHHVWDRLEIAFHNVCFYSFSACKTLGHCLNMQCIKELKKVYAGKIYQDCCLIPSKVSR